MGHPLGRWNIPLRQVLPALLFACLLVSAPAAWAFRCGARAVDVGDYDFQVRARCGDPYWISDTSTLWVYDAYGPVVQRSERIVEEWYYNFGSSRLVQRLVFVDGRLDTIESLGYGRARIGADCNDNAFLDGLREGELVLRCGPPAVRHSRYGDTRYFNRYGYGYVQPRRYEEWHYPGARRNHVRLVILLDGRIDRVEDVRVD